jgi:hypothetical protein
MKSTTIRTLIIASLLLVAGQVSSPAQESEVDQLKAQMKAMEQTMEEMKQKIADLEKKQAEQPAAPATNAMVPGTNAAVASKSVQDIEKLAEGGSLGEPSEITDRGNLNDQQIQAPRLGDHTLDPKYRGFVAIPNTPALIKFNAKPRLDTMIDNRNSGNPDRFVTATIPIGPPTAGGGTQFNMTTKGSSLSLDVQAPDMPGNFRFYYNNDFFGSGSGMAYRLKQLYGEFFNVTAGFTYSIFEDPDVWPNTVDFEGPNAATFARQPTVRYMIPLAEHWLLNLGLQQPATDVNGGPPPSPFTAATPNNQAPDGGFNVRWEDTKRGHVQFAAIFRDLGARDFGVVPDQNVLGWGLNLSASLNLFERDSVQAQLTYGDGIFHFCNDNFFNGDAAYDPAGNLQALEYLGGMVGYTHYWCDRFSSTATFGYVDLGNEPSLGPTFYDHTYYTSVNIVWQLRKHLSVGLEGLWGKKQVVDGSAGDVFRVQLGLVYSLFD